MSEEVAKRIIEECGKLQSEEPDNYALPCPRCGRQMTHKRATQNALSRRADVYICSECGREEALLDLAGVPPLPFSEWAIVPERDELKSDIVICKNCHRWEHVQQRRTTKGHYSCPYHGSLSKIVTEGDTCCNWFSHTVVCGGCEQFDEHHPAYIIQEEYGCTVYARCAKTSVVVSERSVCNHWVQREQVI